MRAHRHPFTILLTIILGLSLLACGGGSKTMGGNSKVIDPSGNWTMTAQDQQGNKVQFAALFNQVGAIVTANSFTAAGNPSPFNCVPFGATLSNGLVANVSNFTGSVAVINSSNQSSFGTFAFNTTLNDAGTSFAGTYAGLPGCTGIGATGTFTGAEVPSVTGNWTGTIQSCNFDQQQGKCASLNGSPSAISFSLTQNDSTGNVSGTYQVANLAPFTSGSVAINPPSDILSGTVLQFSMIDANGHKSTANGTLGADRSFSGLVIAFGTSGGYFSLTMSH
jgi:hypothetical protein